MSTLLVFRAVARIASRSIGASVRRSKTSTSKPSFSSSSAASSAVSVCAPKVMIERSAPARLRRALPISTV
jgi:hypothetical protein